MKTQLVSMFFLITFSLYGCSGGDDADTANAEQSATEQVQEVSQAETMEEIWASSLDPAEKARRVQELLAQQGN